MALHHPKDIYSRKRTYRGDVERKIFQAWAGTDANEAAVKDTIPFLN